MNSIKKLYYYTSTETMQKIIQNGNIWATNLAYMNDAREVVNGLAEIRTIMLDVEKVKNWLAGQEEIDADGEVYVKSEPAEIFTKSKMSNFVDISSKYTISFCEKKDLLSQWIAYARESGVCMEMAFDMSKEIKFAFYGNNPKEKVRSLKRSALPDKILYYTKSRSMSEEHEKETREEILKRMFKNGQDPDVLQRQWNETGTYVKHYDFYQEEEYRIAFHTEEWLPFRIGYRMDKHILKPYLDVACENGWPVTMIMVGPGFNQKVVFDSIKFYLDHEEIQSSALRTVKQWQCQIKDYFAEAEKVCGPMERKDKKRLSDWIKTLRKKSIEDRSGRADIQKHVRELGMGEKYLKYHDDHYFTVSGIILKKSDIPYIY